MTIITTARTRFEALQRRYPALATFVAAVKKFSDDDAGHLAALVAYYGFFSIFPLLLVLVTISSWILAGQPDLQQRLVESSLAQFPILGDTIEENLGELDGSGWALAFGLVAALWAGLGALQAMQTAMNKAWGVPPNEEPNFITSRLRSLAMLCALGAGVIATTALSVLSGTFDRLGFVGRVGLVGLSFGVAVGFFLVAFLVLPALRLSWRGVLPGAILAAAGWVALQNLGVALLAHRLHDASALYGTFGLVIGLLSWMYIQAQLAMFGTELNVVLQAQPAATRASAP